MGLQKIKNEVLKEIFNELENNALTIEEVAKKTNTDIKGVVRWVQNKVFPRPNKFKSLVELVTKDITVLNCYQESTIHQKLFLLRIASGLSLNGLADGVMYSRETLSSWERGIKTPFHTQLIRLSSFYGIDCNDLGLIELPVFPGHIIQEERIALGMSQSSLASHINKSTSTLSNYERGIYAPDEKTIESISIALDLPTGYFCSNHRI